MRKAVLIRSVQQVLGPEAEVQDAAYVWSRHRWMLPFAAAAFTGIVLLAPVATIDDWPTRIVFGAAGVAVAVTATTDYSVIALTETGIHRLTASRIRQVALAVGEKVGADASFEPVGGSGLSTDWLVGDRRFTAPRSSDRAMARMAAAHQK